MVISDTSYMIDGFTIALLTAEFGQVWAKLGLRESRTNFRRDRTTGMRPLDDTASNGMSLWYPPYGTMQGKARSAESGGTIYLDRHRMDTLVTIR